MLFQIVVFLFLLAIGLALYLNRSGVPRFVWGIGIVAFGLRVGYVFVDGIIGIYAGGGDQRAYDATFWFIAEQWRSGVVLAPLQYGASPGNDGSYMLLYSAVFSPAYAVFGHIPILPRLQMGLIGTFVVVNIYLITEYIYGHQAGIAASVISAIYPYWIVLSGIIYRDMFVIFFFTAMAYYVVQWMAGQRHWTVFILAVGTGALGWSLRLVNIIALGAMAAVVVFLLLEKKTGGLAGMGFVGILAGAAAYVKFGNKLSVDQLAGRRLWLARPNAGAYLTGFAYETFVELFVFAPLGALYFMLTPFPWQLINTMAIIAIAQNLFFWYPILLLSAIGLRDILHISSGPKMILPLLGFSLAGIFGYGLVEGNIGPAMRHRSQFQFVFFVLAGVAIANRIEITGYPKVPLSHTDGVSNGR